ncbi:MAG: alpha/beta fold hydrolase [Candidatus Thermoplasmatota archaeon]
MEHEIEFHEVSTSDGWKLGIKRYKPNKVSCPVILCHGLGANSNCLDFDGDEQGKDWKKYSLAYYLLQDKKIFDVWVVDLRGSKRSQTFKPRENPWKYNWNVDTYINNDVPDVIKYVKRIYYNESGKDTKAFWVGKSMGGMIAYAYGMSEEGRRNLKGVVTIGSPVKFENLMNEWGWLLEMVKIFHPRKISFPVRWIKLLEAIGLIDKLKENVANVENVHEEILDKYINIGCDNVVSLKLFLQFVWFIKLKDFCSYPTYPWLSDIFYKSPFIKFFRPYSYTKNLKKFISPVLMIAGSKDKQAPPPSIWYAFQNVGSKDKTYVEFSKKNGTSDYGHFDLTLGKKSKKEVYPVIYEWLRKRV